jgi:hypothetical protein
MRRTSELGRKIVTALVRLALAILRRCRFLSSVDLSLILRNNVDKTLNLPGKLAFLSTDVTDSQSVRELLVKLSPLRAPNELIRLGPDGDGGYLVPDDLAGIEACFSPGVSNVAGFELDCAKRGMKVFMADASVDGPPIAHPSFRFIQKFIGGSSEGDFISLEDWVKKEVGHTPGDLLLQMDIEGFEYQSVLAAPDSILERFRIMVIEFHDMEFLFSAPIFPFQRLAFEKILRSHVCVHIHPNNFCTPITVGDLESLQMAEFTFLRRDRMTIPNPSFANRFPHPLDRDNTERRSYALPKAYYRS